MKKSLFQNKSSQCFMSFRIKSVVSHDALLSGLTGQDVGVSVLRPVDGQVSCIMGKIQPDAFQLLKQKNQPTRERRRRV